MIDSIDELESVEIQKIKLLCARLDPDVLALAMHGISPALVGKFKGSMTPMKRIIVWLSPYKRTAVKINEVEKSHREIVDSFNDLGS